MMDNLIASENMKNQSDILMQIPFSRTIIAYLEYEATTKQCRKTGWNFSENRLKMIFNETEDWIQYYKPIDVNGLTVLDIGAGEGETAKFYIEHGAKKVICVEPSRIAFGVLKDNAARHSEIMPINKSFSLSDLSLSHDFLKIDIEGYEELLLNIRLEQPAVIELHGLQLRDKFQQKGFRIIDTSERGYGCNGCTSYAFWKC
jgi:hypothetical protein